jgi:putative heme-binding domain-containing protein
VRSRIEQLAGDPSPDVQLQVAITATKIEGIEPVGLLTEVASGCGEDPLIPPIVWQNLYPLLGKKERAERFVASLTVDRLAKSQALRAIAPRAVDRILSRAQPEEVPVAGLVAALIQVGTEAARGAARAAIDIVTAKVQSGELTAGPSAAVHRQFEPVLRTRRGSQVTQDLALAGALLAVSWGEASSFPSVRTIVTDKDVDDSDRLDALKALTAAGDAGVLDVAAKLIEQADEAIDFRGEVLATLGQLDDPRVATVVLQRYAKLAPPLRTQAIELLTQRTSWGLALMDGIARGTVDPGSINLNQVRKLLASRDTALVARVKAHWGTVREGRNPQREKVIAAVKASVLKTAGDPTVGAGVFKKVCAQCHKIYGEGQDVGPEITRNGRGSFEQLLSNVFDPSLVIGAAYQRTTVATVDGRVLAGLLVERNPERLVLKVSGGKLETVPARDIDAVQVSDLSLMPEDLEKQVTPQELADLFAFLTLDGPPDHPASKPIPGAGLVRRQAR